MTCFKKGTIPTFDIKAFIISEMLNKINSIFLHLQNNNTLVLVYPNPAKYGINVSFNSWESEKNYKLQLIDASGRTLLIKAMDEVTNWVDFNTLNLVPGQYQLQIFDDLQSVYSNGLVIVPK